MSEEFQGWGTLELMGHRVIRGYIRGVEMYGKQLIKVQPLERRGPDGELLLGEPQYYSPDSMYGLQPATSEEALRQEVTRWDPHIFRPRLVGAGDEADLVDDHEIDDQLMDERDDDPEVHRAEDLAAEIDESDLSPPDFEPGDEPHAYVIDHYSDTVTDNAGNKRGPGFYYHEQEYPEEGSVGPFTTAAEAEVHARSCGEPIAFHYTATACRAREAIADLEDSEVAGQVEEPRGTGKGWGDSQRPCLKNVGRKLPGVNAPADDDRSLALNRCGEVTASPSGAGASPRGAGETVDSPEDDGIPI